MLVPLAVLALGATFAGIAFRHWFIGGGLEEFWRNSLSVGRRTTSSRRWSTFRRSSRCRRRCSCSAGSFVAYYMYLVDRTAPKRLADFFPRALPLPAQQVVFRRTLRLPSSSVRPSPSARLFWKGGDGAIIDGFGPDGISARVLDVTRRAVRLQSGYVYQYAFAMLLGVAALATWYLFGGAR